ncbi:MAG: hypothetical protein R3C99_17985 [Pirellulaceae bacterium]
MGTLAASTTWPMLPASVGKNFAADYLCVRFPVAVASSRRYSSNLPHDAYSTVCCSFTWLVVADSSICSGMLNSTLPILHRPSLPSWQ